MRKSLRVIILVIAATFALGIPAASSDVGPFHLTEGHYSGDGVTFTYQGGKVINLKWKDHHLASTKVDEEYAFGGQTTEGIDGHRYGVAAAWDSPTVVQGSLFESPYRNGGGWHRFVAHLKK